MTLRDQVEWRDDWMWPAGDIDTWPTVQAELAEIEPLVALCRQRRVCVQAGGNGGLWVRPLAEMFEQVYTFEPDPLNFRCLVYNVDLPNVVFTQAALGEWPGMFVAMDRWLGPRNPGANRVAYGQGHIPSVALDTLNLPVVDLLQLDIEGAELHALRGEIATIKRCRPVISVELRGHAGRFGNTDEDVRRWLSDRGYVCSARMNYDEFWIFADGS